MPFVLCREGPLLNPLTSYCIVADVELTILDNLYWGIRVHVIVSVYLVYASCKFEGSHDVQVNVRHVDLSHSIGEVALY